LAVSKTGKLRAEQEERVSGFADEVLRRQLEQTAGVQRLLLFIRNGKGSSKPFTQCHQTYRTAWDLSNSPCE